MAASPIPTWPATSTACASSPRSARVVEAVAGWPKAGEGVAAAGETARDPAMRDFAEEETRAARGRMAELEESLQRMLLPRDPNDDKNLFLEIRAGTGGDESALF